MDIQPGPNPELPGMATPRDQCFLEKHRFVELIVLFPLIEEGSAVRW